jgi:hypothetical protein
MARPKNIKLTEPVNHNLELYLDETVNWKRLIRVMYTLAKGGQATVNQYGTAIKTLPSIDAAKWLFDQRFGKPGERLKALADNADLMTELKKYAEQSILPKSHIDEVERLVDRVNSEKFKVGTAPKESLVTVKPDSNSTIQGN